MVSRSILMVASDFRTRRVRIPSVVMWAACIWMYFCYPFNAPAEVTEDYAEWFPTYRQELTFRFPNEAAAQTAEFVIEPLFDGHHRAVSCRWDDNWTSDNLKTREVMEEFGIQGTWYLNGRSFHPGGKPADYSGIAQQLLKGGNSVGGHALTHPYITYFHSNRMFAEMAGVRIAWEAVLDKPVTSYAYSFVDLRPEPEGRNVMVRTLNTLQRSGFYHVATFNFFDDVKLNLEFSPIMPPENQPYEAFRKAVEWAYADNELVQRYPMISNSMHAWYGTERSEYGYDELRKRFTLLSDLEDVWNCNQNEYGAYRRQVHRSTLSVLKREGQEVTAVLVRPELLSLNDSTPLTISVRKLDSKELEQVTCTDPIVIASQRKPIDRRMFHVRHEDQQGLPDKIGHIANPGNETVLAPEHTDSDFLQVSGLLSVQDGILKVQLRNVAAQSLEKPRITWRVPIGWSVEHVVVEADSCRPGETAEFEQQLKLNGPDLWRMGKAHFAAQLDFVHKGKAGRIHFTCQQDGAEPDSSYPIDGFALLGPIPNAEFDVESFGSAIVEGEFPEQLALNDGKKLRWRQNARDGYINQAWLNPEYVRAMGTWDHISPTYLLRSRVTSEIEQSAEVVLSHDQLCTVFMNGTRIPSRQATLQKGENELIIVYPGAQMNHNSQRIAACFVRLADPVSGERLTNVRYRPY